MKNLFWKRLVAGIGAAAMIAGNGADLVPNVAYAAADSVFNGAAVTVWDN